MSCANNQLGPDIKEIQKRVAYISIGPSTLRNQGAKGVAEAAQHYLMAVDLSYVSKISSQKDYLKWLNRMTNELKEQFPSKARGNWGAARKAINVFLEEAFYNKYLNAEYGIDKIGAFLELPVDSYVISNMKNEFGSTKRMPKWTSIRCLKEEDNEVYQRLALEVADREGILRVFLDLKWWRSLHV
ncbi:hypothetical protein ACFL37_01220 [Candidatus Margulisiibacteriota bacterium]